MPPRDKLPRTAHRTWLLFAAAGLALAWILTATVEGIAPRPGESIALRWLRSVSEHPARCGWALALALWALTEGGTPRESDDESI